MTQQLVKWPFQSKWIVGGFSLTLLLMGLVCFASFKNIEEIKDGANRVQHTYQTLNTLTNFSATMTAAESARRGYIFLGSSQDLQRYQQGAANIRSELKLLEEQIHSTLNQKQRFLHLNDLVNKRLALLEQSIKIYQQDKTELQLQNNITTQSVKLREEILAAIADIQAEEQDYLQSSLNQAKQSINLRNALEISGIILTFFIIFSLTLLLEHQWVKRDQINALESSLAQERKIGELKFQLFSMISHEFRTPLSVILLSSQLLRENLENLADEKQLKNISRIQSSAKNINHILTDILTLTRAEAGQLDYKPHLINLENFCLNLVEDLQLFSTTPHMIEFINHGGNSRAMLDEKLLYSILSNLLLNAIKYSKNQDKIYLILNSDTQATFFQVIDKGIGIPLLEQQKIYEPFYRGQNVENIPGTGLGLAVVKKCLEQHEGEIFVESKVDYGTTFTIKITHQSLEDV